MQAMNDEQAYLKSVPQFSEKEAALLTRAMTDHKAEKKACESQATNPAGSYIALKPRHRVAKIPSATMHLKPASPI